MEQPKVSVIVAIYNADKTILHLLDSLQNQTMKDFEVLMINDGSTDNTPQICDRYAESDSRFKAFHKANQGIGATRQFGLEHAAGDYTIHADADDWVEPDYLESLYDKAVSSGADMVICDIVTDDGVRCTYRKQEPSSYDTKGLITSLMSGLNNGPCNKLIRRSVYSDRNIRFHSGFNYGEDQLFNLELILSGITATYIPKALYHYQTEANPDSAVHGFGPDKIRYRQLFISALEELLPEEYRNCKDNKALEVVYLSILSKSLSGKEFRTRYSYLRRVRWKQYLNKPFSFKLVIWTSLHVSYRLGLLIVGLKKIIRRLKR